MSCEEEQDKDGAADDVEDISKRHRMGKTQSNPRCIARPMPPCRCSELAPEPDCVAEVS